MMNKKGVFITGTDTGVGKTFFACHLLKKFNSKNYRTVAIKPIASGSLLTESGWQNEDALQLQGHASVNLPYEKINPYALIQPIAPHIAAEQQGIKLSAKHLWQQCQSALNYSADFYVVEGSGGWFVPLNEHETLADVAVLLGFPIILVVGMRLGCLNHALLTAKCIQQTKMKLGGWVANCLHGEISVLNEQIEFLRGKIAAPLLTIMPLGANKIDILSNEFLPVGDED